MPFWCVVIVLSLAGVFKLPVFLSWILLVLSLPSQADASTLKNIGFASGFYYFLINRRSLYKDALQRLSGLSWAHIWPSWGALGSTFGGLGAFRWLPEILKLLFLHPGAPTLPPEEPSTAPNSAPGALIAKQRGPGSHQGPHFGTDAFRHLTILEQYLQTKRKTAGDIAKAFPRRFGGCRVQCFFSRFFS